MAATSYSPGGWLIEVVAEPYRSVRRWGLGPGTWTHELIWLPDGFFVAWADKLENGDRVEHFRYPDNRPELVQGNWWRVTGQVVEMAKLKRVQA